MTELVKITAWVTAEEAEAIRAAAAADKRSVSSFAKNILVTAVEKPDGHMMGTEAAA